MEKRLLSSDSLNSLIECRICLIDVSQDEINMQSVIYPCDCRTPLHVVCLEKWLNSKYEQLINNNGDRRQLYVCESCNTKHRIEFEHLNHRLNINEERNYNSINQQESDNEYSDEEDDIEQNDNERRQLRRVRNFEEKKILSTCPVIISCFVIVYFIFCIIYQNLPEYQ